MDDVEYDNWYASLTQEERDSLQVSLCVGCYHGFDDNPRKLLCKTCEKIWGEVDEDEDDNLYV